MVTAAPVQHPQQHSTRLIQMGVKLDQGIIDRMRDLEVGQAWVCHPLMDDLDDILMSKIPEQRRAIYDTVKQGFNDLQGRTITTDDYKHYCGVISSMISELLGRDGRAGDMAERLFEDGDELAGHCANVAYLSVNVSMHLESYIIRERTSAKPSTAKDLTSLGVGAMLHDLGKLQSDPEVKHQHELGREHHEEYGEHAKLGFDMLRDKINPVASTIALHHHQRWNGQGWPDMTRITQGRCQGGFSGHKIHIFARIVAVANAFDNLTDPPGGPKRPGLYALHSLQTPEMASRFDPIVLDAFLRYLPPFPTGAQAVLSNGRLAAVSGLNPDQPCRPKIRYLDGDTDGKDVDLTDHPELTIEESQGLAVGRWLYDLPPKAEALDAAMAGVGG